jgi:hypothetical protein|nr:MAG TPA: hypothetical protein [Caudoviricetes sp.]DAL89640.1 MAG TPA: hypothetical protein [Caudoviricetes sp.]
MPNYPYYYQPYQPYQPPMADQLTQLRQSYQPMQQPQQAPASPSIVWVQSEMEAANYLVAPNSAVTLWDSNSPVVYLKQADASGKPSMKIYDLVERNQRPVQAPQAPAVEYATREQLDALSARVDALSAPKQTKPKKETVTDE